jgi:hypothetical protein
VKTLSRKAWQERKTDMQGSPLDGGS